MTETFDPYRKWLGIPAQDQPPNHYRLLGIELFEADPEVIANAADGRMQLVKTFQIGPYSERSQRLLNEIASAKICLLNPEKRADYDLRLRNDPLSEPPIISFPNAEPSLYLSRKRRKKTAWLFPLLMAAIIAVLLFYFVYQQNIIEAFFPHK
jgi:hypothetical protein